jgi:hypothetical protein
MPHRGLICCIVLAALAVSGALAQDIPHEEIPFSCSKCHPSDDRREVEFDHEQTGFPLHEQHQRAGCTACHDVARFSQIDEGRCQTCHEAVADTEDEGMPHQEVSHSCGTCHTESGDPPIEFDHELTGFTLEGRHVGTSCRRCHDVADFSRTGNECRSCHTDAHQARLYPDCERCHTPSSWTVTDHNKAHASTAFQLIGKHVRVDCGSCHTREIYGAYERLSPECYACHQSDYESAQDPAHSEFDFGTDCEECHSQMAWHPSSLRRHLGSFPIYAGEHAGEWSSCSTCHTEPGDYGTFSCLNCHAHNQSEMDEEHDDEPGYWYSSFACFACHPNGQVPEDDRRSPAPGRSSRRRR